MNSYTLSQKITGRQLGEELTKEEDLAAAHAGLLVVYGYSDDNLEFRGIYYDEIPCYIEENNDSETFYFVLDGETLEQIQQPDLTDQSMRYLEVTATWCPQDIGASWLITCNVKSHFFDVMEVDVDTHDIFCRGIVVDVEDIKSYLLGD